MSKLQKVFLTLPIGTRCYVTERKVKVYIIKCIVPTVINVIVTVVLFLLRQVKKEPVVHIIYSLRLKALFVFLLIGGTGWAGPAGLTLSSSRQPWSWIISSGPVFLVRRNQCHFVPLFINSPQHRTVWLMKSHFRRIDFFFLLSLTLFSTDTNANPLDMKLNKPSTWQSFSCGVGNREMEMNDAGLLPEGRKINDLDLASSR